MVVGREHRNDARRCNAGHLPCVACGRDESRNPESKTDDEPTIDWYECSECGRTFSPDGGLDPCPECGSLLHIRVDGPEGEA